MLTPTVTYLGPAHARRRPTRRTCPFGPLAMKPVKEIQKHVQRLFCTKPILPGSSMASADPAAHAPAATPVTRAVALGSAASGRPGAVPKHPVGSLP